MESTNHVEMSNKYGSNPDYVLAGGGNTSVKDDENLYVKCSGTQLATITADGFVKMSRKMLNEIVIKEYPSDDAEREAAYLSDVFKAVTDEDTEKRPSVEALLHNLFAYKYVLHIHPTLINGMTCGVDGERACADLLGDDVLWVPICKPGYTLANICYKLMNEYKANKGKDLQVMLLQNHGIFVSADTVDEISVLFDDVMDKLTNVIKRTADLSNDITDEQTQASQKLTEALGHHTEPVPVKEAMTFVKDIESAAPLMKPFTPDHIVYCGPYPLFIENIDDAAKTLNEFMQDKEALPRLILVKGVGAFIMEDDSAKAAKAQLLAKDAIKLAVYAESFGGALPMTDELIYFITHWEAEAYRSKK